MKQRHLRLNCLVMTAALLSALVLPCRAMAQPTVCQVASADEFLQRYHGEDEAESFRTYVARQALIFPEDVDLDETLGEVELAATAGIRVTSGATLTLDNEKLLVMGPPPVITVEAGSTLCVLNWGEMMTDGNMPTDGMIAVEAGGALRLGEGIVLPDGMVSDYNVPPDTLLPPITIPTPEPEPEPEPTPEPFNLTGEVMRVNPQGEMTVYLTMPRLPDDTKSFCVQRSEDESQWTQALTFRMSQTLADAVPRWEAVENPLLVAKHSDDKTSTFLPYVEQVTAQPFFLRVVLERNSGETAVSQSVKILPTDEIKPGGDYDDSGGNRGGGSQGKNDRVEQQTPEVTPAPTEEETQPPEIEIQKPTAAETVAEENRYFAVSQSYSGNGSSLNSANSSGQAASVPPNAGGTDGTAVKDEKKPITADDEAELYVSDTAA